MGWPRNPLPFFGGGDDRPSRSERKVGGGFDNPGDKSRGPDIVRPFSMGGDLSLGLDPDTLQELDDIRLQGELALAEHAQRVAAANAVAGQKRRAVDRDIGIQNRYRGIATNLTQQGYDDLIGTLEGIVPLTQQAYDTGVSEIGQAYDTGQQLLTAPQQGGVDLGAQLQAIAGEGADQFAANVNDPLAYTMSLLDASGTAAQGTLGTLGAGDVAAAYAALPGYGEEGQTAISDINLEVDAALNDLRNERSMITPEFIPFNQGELELRQRQAIREAIEAGVQRRRSEDEENYSGYRGVQNLAMEYNRPDLANEFFDIYSQAAAGQVDDLGQTVPLDIALQRAINAFESRGTRGEQERDRQIILQLMNAFSGNY